VRPVPLTDIAALPGIAHAAASARDAVDVVLRQPSARRQAAVVAATSVVRGASASARLEGAEPDRTDDPLVLGALRATGAAVEMAGLWARAPLQVLARLHLLAAADLADPDTVGRPVDAEAARRLTALVRDVGTSAASEVPAMVVAAVVHAEVAEAFAGPPNVSCWCQPASTPARCSSPRSGTSPSRSATSWTGERSPVADPWPGGAGSNAAAGPTPAAPRRLQPSSQARCC
jgi:hypothetical protein